MVPIFRASPSVLSMWLCKNIFSHPRLVIYFFAIPPIKLKLLVQQSGGGLLIANHLDQSLWWPNHKHWARVRSHLLHSFQQVRKVVAPFTSYRKLCNHAEPKPIFLSQIGIFLTFLHLILLCRITNWTPLEMLLGHHNNTFFVGPKSFFWVPI